MDKKQEQQLVFVNALKALDFEKEYLASALMEYIKLKTIQLNKEINGGM